MMYRPYQLVSLAEMFGNFGYDSYYLNQLFHVFKQSIRGAASDNDISEDYIIDPMPENLAVWGMIENVVNVCRRMDLDHVLSQVDRLKRIFSRPHKFIECETAINSLQERLEDELQKRWFYYIDVNKVKLYQNQIPAFGQEVFDKFDTANKDIDEAVKCYALGRNTATVFHCMRVLEAGIRALARSLSIPDPTKGAEKNWGDILKKIDTAINNKWPDSKSQMLEEYGIFHMFYTALLALKYSRNETMHLSKSYDSDDAKYFLDITGSFMKQIANRMDENGLPLA